MVSNRSLKNVHFSKIIIIIGCNNAIKNTLRHICSTRSNTLPQHPWDTLKRLVIAHELPDPTLTNTLARAED